MKVCIRNFIRNTKLTLFVFNFGYNNAMILFFYNFPLKILECEHDLYCSVSVNIPCILQHIIRSCTSHVQVNCQSHTTALNYFVNITFIHYKAFL